MLLVEKDGILHTGRRVSFARQVSFLENAYAICIY
jgi:hypothetical protein